MTFFLLDVFYEHKNVAFFVFVRLFNVFLIFMLVKFSLKKKQKRFKITLITSITILLPEFLTLPKTSWPHLHDGDSFNSYNIEGIGNNGMLCISSNIENTVNKNVHFSIYNDSRLLEVIAVSHNFVISEISRNMTTGLLGCCNGVCLSNAIDITRFSSLLRLLRVTA